jgi:sugar diacid utilization regulator
MHGIAPSTADVADGALRDQLTSLLSLLVLSIRMTESRSDAQILEFAVGSVPSLVDCRVHGVFLESGGWSLTTGPLEAEELRAGLEAQFAVLSDAGGAVSIQGDGWGWAFPLRGLAGHLGHLVVGADREPSSLDQFLIRVLAQQVGIALANARSHARELRATTELRAANVQLADSVAAIRRRAEIHERLTGAAMAGTGLAGIAEAVHELTGRAILVEDRAGNVIAQAGADDTDSHVRQARGARERLIQRAIESGEPIRELDRVVVLVGPRDGVAGLMSMGDPDGAAGEPEIVALEHGATVAAMELARLRSLGETQLRLGRDLLEDLLAGMDPQVAIERARAIGCDLLHPRRVAVIEAAGLPPDDDRLVGAVRRALRDHVAGWLLTVRGSVIVVLADAETDWHEVETLVERNLGDGCRLGVGGVVSGPAEVSRSHREALLALRMGQERAIAAGLTVFDELGVFRLFAEVEDPASVERFVRAWLGPLLDYDEAKPAELVLTLTRFLELGQAYDATSQALSIHRSTLKYRLQRIREIAGRDLSDPDTRFNLQLATRAWQTLVALRDGQTASARGPDARQLRRGPASSAGSGEK